MYSRKSWVGYDLAVDAIALLECHHGLFNRVMNKFVGPPRCPPTADSQAPRQANGWLDAMEAEAFVDAQPLQGSREAADEGQEHGQQQEQQQPPMDDAPGQNQDYWAEFNRRKKLDVQSWCGTNPGHRLLLLKEMLAVMLGLMAHFLYVGSTHWEERQVLKAARGETRKFLVVEAALGHHVTEAMTCLKNVLQRPMPAIPGELVRAELASLRFRLTSAALTAMHILVRLPRANTPYSVFALLGADEAARAAAYTRLCSTPRCMWDQLYTLLRTKFQEDADLLQADCQAILQALAAVYSVDISAIEARHASTREFTMLRSRGWVPNLEAVGSKFATQRYANAMPATKPETEQKDGTRARRPRGGGGGAWRAFCSDVSRGRQLADMESLSAQYRALSPEERSRYLEAGAAGTEAHRAGFAAFGIARRRTRENTPRALPGTLADTGALVALDAVREQQMAPYTGPDALEEYTAQVSLALTPDELTKQEREELSSFQQDVPGSAQILSTLQSELSAGIARDVFGAAPRAGAVNITGLRWTPPTATLVQARQVLRCTQS